MTIKEELALIREEMRGIKDALNIMMKKRPDQTCKIRFKQILDELKRMK